MRIGSFFVFELLEFFNLKLAPYFPHEYDSELVHHLNENDGTELHYLASKTMKTIWTEMHFRNT